MRKKFSDTELMTIWESTGCRCHICRKQLSFVNYASFGKKGAWEVDHSNPISNGGTSYLRNLKPACISCNRKKGKGCNRSARMQHGHTSAPLSKRQREQNRKNNALGFGLLGTALGMVFGPGGLVIGAIAGTAIGSSIEDE